MNLTDELQSTLDSFPNAECYWIAYSGGCDSHVLLHALHAISSDNSKIAAIHVDHGLQDSAEKWSEHCRQVCVDLNVQFKLLKVNAKPLIGQSPEAAAREARYKAIAEFLPENDALLVAHHQDDQAETLLLQLLRGAGPRGLSAMPKMKMMGNNQLLRPFLNISQKSIRDYAKQNQLNWIEDPSNIDIRFDRNRIRHEIIPVMKQRWPSLSKTLGRVTQYQAEATECLRELAELDFARSVSKEHNNGLQISKIRQLSLARQKNLLRYWIEQRHQFDAIDSAHLNRIFNEVIPAAIDSQPVVQWQNTQVCRYRGILYVLAVENDSVINEPQLWNALDKKEFAGQCLISHEVRGEGIKQSMINNGILNVRFRQGGERCQPKGRANHHSLKNLFQEWAIPPWRRSKIPLIYIGDEIAQIVGYCVCEPYVAEPDEPGLLISSENS